MAATTCAVCGKSFDPDTDPKGGFRWFYETSWQVFDDIGCRNKFIGNPKKYTEGEGDS